jgi:hypothetical protein
MVIGTTRHAAKRGSLEAMGAKPLLLDALDRNAVITAVQRERPEVIVNELTAIPVRFNLRRFDRELTAAIISSLPHMSARSTALSPKAMPDGPMHARADR